MSQIAELFDRTSVRVAASMVISLGICAIGLWAASITGNAVDAARAGAVIVAFTLFLAIRSKGIADALDQHVGERQVDKETREALIKAERTERTLIFSVPTFIGTMFWGFGDLLAEMLI